MMEPGLLPPLEGMVCMLILIPVIILAFMAFAGFLKLCFWVFKGIDKEM
jgi:hypothetical protein